MFYAFFVDSILFELNICYVPGTMLRSGFLPLLCFASWVTHLPRLSKVVAWWQNGFIGDKGTSHQSFLSSKHWKFPFTWVAEMSASKVINFLSKQPGLWTGDYNRALSLS